MPLFSDDPSSCSPYPLQLQGAAASKNMACQVKGDTSNLLPVISFLGATLTTTAFVFLLATLDVNWRLSALASSNNGAQPALISDEMLPRDNDHAIWMFHFTGNSGNSGQ
ncbi:hypothetical protein ABZP36_027684 [Zizania latifolia]